MNLAERCTERPRANAGQVNSLASDTAAIILAGGKGARLGPLTRRTCKPALPFGGAYRNIDFSLANCVNSGIARIGVAIQHQPRELLSHLDHVWRRATAKSEQLISSWLGEERAPDFGYRGTADAVYRNLPTIERLRHRLVLVLAGDHVYKMDYRPMLEQHVARGAAVTIGCAEVQIAEANEFGIMSVNYGGRIDRFVEKPKTLAELPGRDRSHALASMGIYVFETEFLARVLRLDALSSGSRHDFGCDILPRLIREADAFAYRFSAPGAGGTAYWRDIGTVAAYWRAHMELLGPSPQLRLDDPYWPLPSTGRAGVLRLDDPRNPERSLVAVDSTIRGSVRRSVLFEGVEIQHGAEVADAVILPNAVVESGCRLRGVIVDSGCRVTSGTVVDRSSDGAMPHDRLQPAVLTADDSEGHFGPPPARVA